MSSIGNPKHGLSKTRIHRIWHSMYCRCYYPKTNGYKNYGGRGIKVCEEWKHLDGFINFYNWAMSHGYNDYLTLDRIDNDKDYEPSNCRWITPKEQSNIREIEAESIALVVSNRLGLQTTDFNLGYIAKFSDGDLNKFKANLDVVRSVSYQILSSVEPALQTHLKEKVASTENTSENTTKDCTKTSGNKEVKQTIEESETKPKTRKKSAKTKEKDEVEQC